VTITGTEADDTMREHSGQSTWDCLETGPQARRVRIGQSLAVTPSRGDKPGGAESDSKDGGQEPDLNVSHALTPGRAMSS
jgi:hypothetical protein